MSRIAVLSLFLIISSTSVSAGTSWERMFFSPASSRDMVFTSEIALLGNSHGLFRAPYRIANTRVRFRRPRADIPGRPEIIAVAAANGISEMYAVTGAGYLLRSVDQGQTFRMIGEFPSTRITSIALSKSGQLFVGSSQGVMISDAALSGIPTRNARTYLMPWESLVLGLPIFRRAHLAPDSDLWNEWNMIFDGVITNIEVDPVRPDHVIVNVFDDGAYQSFDDGGTWSKIYSDSERVHGPIAFGSDGRAMIGIYLSLDGGKTWRKTGLCPDPEDLLQKNDVEFRAHSVAITPTHLWALNYQAAKIYRSVDGTDWKRMATGKDFFAKDKETSPSLLEVDTAGMLWVGTDRHGVFKFAGDNQQ